MGLSSSKGPCQSSEASHDVVAVSDNGGVTDAIPPVEWWQHLERSVRGLVVVNESLAVVTALVNGHPRISTGRSFDGWQRRACEQLGAVASSRFEAVKVIDAHQLSPSLDVLRPPIGGLLVKYERIEVALAVLIDDVGEIYAAIHDERCPL